MKKLSTLIVLFFLVYLATNVCAQNQRNNRAKNPNKDICFKIEKNISVQPSAEKVLPLPASKIATPTEVTIGETVFDLQTNSTAQKRIFVYADGTIGATWIIGTQSSNSYPDRGTGYNYFDGSSWGSYPNYRVESIRTGWPAYAPFGSGGEIICSHSGGSSGLVLSKRTTKGSGLWSQSTLAGPSANPNILWPRMVTSGSSHDTIHIIAITAPVANAGTVYNGLDGALLYYRSINGGSSFDKVHIQPTGLTSTNYVGFGGDRYAWANPVGDTLAFVMGDNWYDLMLCKSTDGGDTWTHQLIFQHPYPMFKETTTLVNDTPWVCDGGMAVALDKYGNAHVAFGLMRVLNTDLTDGTTSYFPFTDGLAYWKEGEAPFSTLDIDSVEARGNLVAWMQDLNQNGTLDFISTATTALGLYYMSITSMPQIHVDDDDNVFIVYSSVQENAHNSLQNYRRIWGRGKIGSVNSWDTMFNITAGIVHNFNECVFPSIAPTSSSDIHIVYQYDTEPGLSVRGDLDAPGINGIAHSSVPKDDFLMSVGLHTVQPNLPFQLSQNYPNPFSETTTILLRSPEDLRISLEIYDLPGKKIKEYSLDLQSEKEYRLVLDAADIGSGIYFYSVSDGQRKLTKKMIIQ